jgi:hypothetical protein
MPTVRAVMDRFHLLAGLQYALVALAPGGCATVLHGTTQEISILSGPPGARVEIDGVPSGQTPLVTKLPRKQAHQVRIEANGYLTYETTLRRSAGPWLWPDIVGTAMFVVPLPVDALSGALYELSPKQVQATLVPRPDTLAAGGDVPVAGEAGPAPRPSLVMPGQRVRVTSHQFWLSRQVATVAAASADTIVLEGAEPGGGRVPVPAIQSLEVRRGPTVPVGTGLRAGAGLGAVLGVAVAVQGLLGVASARCNPTQTHADDSYCLSAAGALLLGVPAAGLLGAGLGALVAHLVSTERWRSVPLDSLRAGAPTASDTSSTEAVATLLPGSFVRVTGADSGGWTVEGRVRSLHGDRLELALLHDQTPMLLSLARVRRLEVVAGSHGHAREGAAVGALVGLGLAVQAASRGCDFCRRGDGMDWVRGTAYWASVATLAAASIAVGEAVGAHIATESWQPVPKERLRIAVLPLPRARLGVGASVAF